MAVVFVNIFFQKGVDMPSLLCYTIMAMEGDALVRQHAAVAELADARDLKSRDTLYRTGSIPVSGTIVKRYIAE